MPTNREFSRAELEKGYNLYCKAFQEFELPLCSFLPFITLPPLCYLIKSLLCLCCILKILQQYKQAKKTWYNQRTHTGRAFSTAEQLNWKSSRENCSSPHPQLLERLSCLYEIHTNSERFSEKISNFKEQINFLFSNTKKNITAIV